MAVTSIQRDTNNNVSLVRMEVTDTLTDVSTAGYVLAHQEAIDILNGGIWGWFTTDMVLVAASNGNAFFQFPDDTFETLVIYGEQGSGIVNPGLVNEIAFYPANGSSIDGLVTLANAILGTNGSGVPAMTQTLPFAVQDNIVNLGTITSGTWQGTAVDVAHGGSGNTSFTAYSVLCAGVTSTGAFQNVSGLGTSGQILTSNGAGLLPSWKTNAATGTVDVGSVNAIAYYPAATAEVAPIATALNAVLVTSGAGVPFLGTTLPSAVQGNITSLGTIATGVWQGTPVALAYGGTNANLTAANGAMPYSTATALALLAPGTSGQLLQSGGAGAPNWTTATYPSTTIVNQFLYSSSSNVIAGFPSAQGAVLVTDGVSAPEWLANPSAANKVLLSTNGGAPFWSTGGFPTSAGSAGTILRSDGTNWAASTATFADTYAVSTILYASSSNTVTGMAAAQNGVLVSGNTNIPSMLAGPGSTGLTLLSNAAAAPQWSTGKPITQVVVQVFTSGTPTYTPTTGMQYATLEVVGGGGGGGSIPTTSAGVAAGGGGGGGGYARKTVTAATIGASQTITVGAGGAGGAAGSNPGATGSTSSVGSIVTATGGTGGAFGVKNTTAYQIINGLQGVGGLGASGDFNCYGSNAQNGVCDFTSSTAAGGVGGGSFLGQTGQIPVYNVAGKGASAAANTGCGGAGAGEFNNGIARAGGDGGSGLVIITEYVSV